MTVNDQEKVTVAAHQSKRTIKTTDYKGRENKQITRTFQL